MSLKGGSLKWRDETFPFKHPTSLRKGACHWIEQPLARGERTLNIDSSWYYSYCTLSIHCAPPPLAMQFTTLPLGGWFGGEKPRGLLSPEGPPDESASLEK